MSGIGNYSLPIGGGAVVEGVGEGVEIGGESVGRSVVGVSLLPAAKRPNIFLHGLHSQVFFIVELRMSVDIS